MSAYSETIDDCRKFAESSEQMGPVPILFVAMVVGVELLETFMINLPQGLGGQISSLTLAVSNNRRRMA